jgi:hypothetical protein
MQLGTVNTTNSIEAAADEEKEEEEKKQTTSKPEAKTDAVDEVGLVFD